MIEAGTQQKTRSKGAGARLLGRVTCGLLLVASQRALAQESEHAEIVVTARLPLAGITPERSLNSADVESYGVGTVGELVSEIAAEDGEDREDAAFLVNGKRVAGLGNVADLPAEAILTIDVLPAGSGLSVGATSRQRVYNLRLRRELDLAAVRGAVWEATAGGWSSQRGDVSLTHIRAERRLTLAAKLRDEELLLESERGIVQPPTFTSDAGRFRSLLPANDRIDLSLSAADQLANWLTASLNSKFALANRRSLLGQGVGPADPLAQRNDSRSSITDVTLNAQAGSWQIGLFGNYAHLRQRTLTERSAGDGADPTVTLTSSVLESLSGQVSAFGPIVQMPAGPVVLNMSASLSRDALAGRRRTEQVETTQSETLSTSTLSATIEVPIASRSAGSLAFLGDLSASAEYTRQQVTGFGSFQNYIGSLAWRPTAWLNLNGLIRRSVSAPPVASIDEPLIETPNVRYFDPLRAETVDVTRFTGGTSDLQRERDRTTRLAAHITPLRKLALRMTAEYTDVRASRLIAELPVASLSILQAFPDRFIRDAIGRLIAVDARPVQLGGQRERQLRTGLNFTLPLGRRAGALADDEDEQTDSPAKRTGSGVRPRLQISASHAWLLASELSLRPGEPAVDLLSPNAIGLGGRGLPRHRFDFSLGYAERGLGVRAIAQSRSLSFVEARGAAANVLRFQPITTLALRGWIQGERLAPDSALLKGTRLSLSIANLTNARERVVDRFGVTPLSYQPGYRDPIGRSLEIELRKKF